MLKTGNPFWQRESYDHENNPVRAGLAQQPGGPPKEPTAGVGCGTGVPPHFQYPT
jgi:hypothetical protein